VRAVLIHSYGDSERVRIEEVPRPTPGPDELLVRVQAASINPVDFKIRDGAVKVLLKYRFPLILGNDLCGVVEAVGPSVTGFAPGDEVYARLDKDRIGALAEYALVRQSAAAKKPANLDAVQAASIPLVGLTAWQALIELGKLGAGQRVLIHAGSGGVGTFAIQLAKHLGAEVATTVGARNAALVRKLGADVVIDYKTQRFEDVLKDYDLVFDTQGGETLERSFAVVRPGGTVVTVGGKPDAKFARAWGVNPLIVLVLRILMRRITGLAKNKNARFEYLFMRASGEQLTQIGELIERGVIKPIIDRTFPLDQAKEALAYVEAGRATGKVVVTIS
jgi:alcohol dehydrogenase